MANIKQQKKRVRLAAEQRVQNLRWRSTSKTLMRRLREAAESSDAAQVEERHRELVRWLGHARESGLDLESTQALITDTLRSHAAESEAA